MKRVIEKLTHKRKEKEKAFAKKLKEIDKRTERDILSTASLQLENRISLFNKLLTSAEKSPKKDSSQKSINQQINLILKELQSMLDQNFTRIKEILLSLKELNKLNDSLAEARDEEWDALGSNHVRIIFKSMEWKVDKLASEYKDVKILMKKFILLKEKLNRLLSVLEEPKTPSSAQLKEILEPLEDWRYVGFENRFRGNEEDVKKQQESYLPYFKNKGKVLDLGCGRGEFLELLKKNGIESEGLDVNQQMVDICHEKGLCCQKGDILEKLAEKEDNSLSGIFSSQVIEHLLPSYLKRLLELAYIKLAPLSHIVLETINPTSVFSLVQIYFLDISHEKPLHPQALKFLMESVGFEDVEIKYSKPMEEEKLRELPGADETISIMNQNIDKLNRLLYSPPNYAVIGKKI